VSGAYVRSLTIDDPERLADVVPGASFRAHALFAGPFRVEVQTFDLGDIALQVGRSSPFAGLAAAAPSRAILQVPFGKIETLLLNGVALERPGIGVYGPGAELQRSNPQENRHFTLTLPASLVEPLLEPPSNARLFRQGRARLLHGPTAPMSRAVALVRQANAVARRDPQSFEHEQARLSLRATLLQAARFLLAQASDAPVRRSRETPARMRIIRAADEFIRARRGQPLYPEQLSTALGLSGRALHEAFIAHFATSPHRLLERRRLEMVRADMTAAGRAWTSIRGLALARGFWNFGQFQIDYQTNFGETLTETMRKGPGNVVQFHPRQHELEKTDTDPSGNPSSGSLPFR
jgi:AraC-like DNA-binding protein